MVRNLKDSLKACKWDAARYSLRFLADLVNCHVISAGSLLQLLDNMVDAAKEDGVPQVCRLKLSWLPLLFRLFFFQAWRLCAASSVVVSPAVR